MHSTITSTATPKTLGFCKNKTYLLTQFKESQQRKKMRFRKDFQISSPLAPGKKTDNEALLLNTSRSDSIVEIELPMQPPAWIGLAEKVRSELTRVKELHKELHKLIGKRMKHHFSDSTAIDKEMNTKNLEISSLLHECEAHLKKIATPEFGQQESEAEKKVRLNMQKSLASDIQDATLMVQKQQKAFLEKMKKHNPEINSSLDVRLDVDEEETQQLDVHEEIAQQRDSQINWIIKSINEMSQIFKHINGLVIEQGTIIDRIDYNLETAETHTQSAKKELVKSKTRMENGYGNTVIKGLTTLIIIFSILLIIKFYNRG